MRRILTISVLRSCWRAARAPATTLRAPRARLRRPPGELEASFDAGGRKLHLLAGQVRVCTYDRLNVGRSDRATGRHTGADSVRDLHALLDAAAVPEPYLLVGFSFGGLLAIMYAGTYPDQVMGMVSLDGSLPPTTRSTS